MKLAPANAPPRGAALVATRIGIPAHSIAKRRALLVSFVLLGAVLRFANLGTQSYWADEAVTVIEAASRSFGSAFVYALWNDTHPPLFVLLLHPWLRLGLSEAVTRVLPAILGVAAIPAVYVLGRRMLDARLGLIAALLLAVSPFHVAFSQELRMYSLVMLMVLLAGVFYQRILSGGGRSDWWGFVGCSVLGLYSENLAALVLFALAAHYVLAVRPPGRRMATWLKSQLAVVVLSAPVWAIAVYQLRQLRGDSWVPVPSPSLLVATLQAFGVGHTAPELLLPFAGVLFGGALLVGVSRLREIPAAVGMLLSWVFLPVLALYVVSILFVPIYVERALIICLPAFLLLVGLGTLRLGRPILVAAVVTAFLIASGFSLASYYADPSYTKPDARGTFDYVATIVRPDDLVLHPSPMTYEPFVAYDQITPVADRHEYALVSREYYALWVEAQRRLAENGDRSDLKGLILSRTPYGDWRRDAHEYTRETLRERVTTPDELPALLSSFDRVIVVALDDRGIEQIGRRLYSTRQGWLHPMAIDFTKDWLPGFHLVETEISGGFEIRVYSRNQEG